MKSRYLFNATTRSVLVTPHDYVFDSVPGYLRLVQPSGAVHAIRLIVLIAVIFGYIGLFDLVASSRPYQAARPWDNPTILWTVLALFFIGFFVLLFGTERWGQHLAVMTGGRFSGRSSLVSLRGHKVGKLIQKGLLTTADNRVLSMEIEATKARFREALELAKVPLPIVPLTKEEFESIESSRQAVSIAAPGRVGPGRFNFPGVAIVIVFAGFFDGLFVWAFASGEFVLGTFGFVIFGPLTGYMLYAVARTRRFHCAVCDRVTVFRRRGETWTCAGCGESWPRAPAGLRMNG
jgi:hypothetical protein